MWRGKRDALCERLPPFSLKQGGRATAALWQSSAPVRNVYTYDIKARRNPASGGVSYSSASATPRPVMIENRCAPIP